MEQRYNIQSPAVKRLMRECSELSKATVDFHAQPCNGNLFEWHFTIRGAEGTDYEQGIYHGRITLPPEYPMKPPSIVFLTPNGRFKIGEKICLSISGYHPETWLPSWSIRTALIAIIAFMPQAQSGGLGSLEFTSDERRHLAIKSMSFICNVCGSNPAEVLLSRCTKEETKKSTRPEKTSVIKTRSLEVQAQFRKRISVRMGIDDISKASIVSRASKEMSGSCKETGAKTTSKSNDRQNVAKSQPSNWVWSDWLVPALFLLLIAVLYPRISALIPSSSQSAGGPKS